MKALAIVFKGALVLALSICAFGQDAGAPQGNATPPHSSASAEESSSRQTLIDLSPPMGDAVSHPDSRADEVTEMHQWNPLKALRSTEVGDYYYKQKNYSAALSRYQEALEYKPKDAAATFKLALTQEKLGQFADARTNYESYLKILPGGPYTADARKGIERLSKAGLGQAGAVAPGNQRDQN